MKRYALEWKSHGKLVRSVCVLDTLEEARQHAKNMQLKSYRIIAIEQEETVLEEVNVK